MKYQKKCSCYCSVSLLVCLCTSYSNRLCFICGSSLKEQ